jgi:hypothetical protein
MKNQAKILVFNDILAVSKILVWPSHSRSCNASHCTPRFAGCNTAESNGLLRVIKIHSMTSFGRGVKLSAPRDKILRHVKDPLRYDRDTDRQNSVIISHPVSPRFANRCNQSNQLQPQQRTLVDVSGMIRAQMGSTIHHKTVAVAWYALYDTTPKQ